MLGGGLIQQRASRSTTNVVGTAQRILTVRIRIRDLGIKPTQFQRIERAHRHGTLRSFNAAAQHQIGGQCCAMQNQRVVAIDDINGQRRLRRAAQHQVNRFWVFDGVQRHRVAGQQRISQQRHRRIVAADFTQQRQAQIHTLGLFIEGIAINQQALPKVIKRTGLVVPRQAACTRIVKTEQAQHSIDRV